MSQDQTAAVLQAEKVRCDAMLQNDAAALDAVLDPGLRFGHATGSVDDKAGYLAKMAAGRIDYVDIAWREPVVTALGPEHAMLTGRMETQVRVEGVEKHLDNSVMTIWRRAEVGWRMLAFQSTPVKG